MNASEKIIALLRSRRFYLMLVGLVTVMVMTAFDVDETTATQIATVIAAWILGDSIRETSV